MHRILKLVSLIAIIIASGPALAEDAWRDGEFRGTVILTVTGNVAHPTRSASSEAVDKFFHYNDISFDKAAQFDSAALLALPQVVVKADFPKGGAISDFEGPTLEDVLNSVGATGAIVTIRALDGYAVEIPIEDTIANSAVVALKRDGIPFAIGDFGPTHIVFPRAERPELAEMPDDWWVWSIYHIHVE